MRILVTGGCGFIGSNTSLYFKEKGYEVIALDNFSRAGTRNNEKELRKAGIKISPADITVDYLYETIGKVDAIIHTAASASIPMALSNPVLDFKTNAWGTLNILEYAREVEAKAFIFLASNKVYSAEKVNSYNGLIPEDFPIDGNRHAPYGCSKVAGDLLTREYATLYGLPAVSNRLSCIYGPHQWGTEEQGWIAHFCISAMLKKPITIYGDGKQSRDCLFISDLVRLFETQLENIERFSGRAFNIGGGLGNVLSLLDLIFRLESRYGKVNKTFVPARPQDHYHYCSDITKIWEVAGWKPEVSLDEGIDKLIDWCEGNIEKGVIT